MTPRPDYPGTSIARVHRANSDSDPELARWENEGGPPRRRLQQDDIAPAPVTEGVARLPNSITRRTSTGHR